MTERKHKWDDINEKNEKIIHASENVIRFPMGSISLSTETLAKADQQGTKC